MKNPGIKKVRAGLNLRQNRGFGHSSVIKSVNISRKTRICFTFVISKLILEKFFLKLIRKIDRCYEPFCMEDTVKILILTLNLCKGFV